MTGGPTVNLVSDHLVACYEDTCEIYQEGSWQHFRNTTATRTWHSSATTEDAVLLIGGSRSNSTEWIPVDGSVAKTGPFTVRHGISHCTCQLSDDILVVTGGAHTKDFVTEYHLKEGMETHHPSLGQPRFRHACGVYQDTNDQQVSKRLGEKNKYKDRNTNTQKQRVKPGHKRPTSEFKGFAASSMYCTM